MVFTNDVKRCDYYKQESQNVKNKGYCKYPDNYLQFKEAQGNTFYHNIIVEGSSFAMDQSGFLN